MTGYVTIIEQSTDGYGAYSPDLPGCVAVGDTPEETEQLMREAVAEHIALLREMGQPVPPPSNAAAVLLVTPAA
jgi:predicted RNase H-like HicB family nuclease